MIVVESEIVAESGVGAWFHVFGPNFGLVLFAEFVESTSGLHSGQGESGLAVQKDASSLVTVSPRLDLNGLSFMGWSAQLIGFSLRVV